MSVAINIAYLTDRENRLVANLAVASKGDVPTPERIEAVYDLLRDGSLEFGLVGTDKEHIHLAHDPHEHAQWCWVCTEVVDRVSTLEGRRAR